MHEWRMLPPSNTHQAHPSLLSYWYGHAKGEGVHHRINILPRVPERGCVCIYIYKRWRYFGRNRLVRVDNNGLPRTICLYTLAFWVYRKDGGIRNQPRRPLHEGLSLVFVLPFPRPIRSFPFPYLNARREEKERRNDPQCLLSLASSLHTDVKLCIKLEQYYRLREHSWESKRTKINRTSVLRQPLASSPGRTKARQKMPRLCKHRPWRRKALRRTLRPAEAVAACFCSSEFGAQWSHLSSEE